MLSTNLNEKDIHVGHGWKPSSSFTIKEEIAKIILDGIILIILPLTFIVSIVVIHKIYVWVEESLINKCS